MFYFLGHAKLLDWCNSPSFSFQKLQRPFAGAQLLIWVVLYLNLQKQSLVGRKFLGTLLRCFLPQNLPFFEQEHAAFYQQPPSKHALLVFESLDTQKDHWGCNLASLEELHSLLCQNWHRGCCVYWGSSHWLLPPFGL